MERRVEDEEPVVAAEKVGGELRGRGFEDREQARGARHGEESVEQREPVDARRRRAGDGRLREEDREEQFRAAREVV